MASLIRSVSGKSGKLPGKEIKAIFIESKALGLNLMLKGCFFTLTQVFYNVTESHVAFFYGSGFKN